VKNEKWKGVEFLRCFGLDKTMCGEFDRLIEVWSIEWRIEWRDRTSANLKTCYTCGKNGAFWK
jgi:hypothetical protein